jgi:hypothetical protein
MKWWLRDAIFTWPGLGAAEEERDGGRDENAGDDTDKFQRAKCEGRANMEGRRCSQGISKD